MSTHRVVCVGTRRAAIILGACWSSELLLALATKTRA